MKQVNEVALMVFELVVIAIVLLIVIGDWGTK